MDLRFPNHENEVAQAEAADGVGFANYWMHIGLLTVDGEKMSKSIGNIVNVKDLLKKWDAEVVRFFFASAHYRSPPDFSEKALSNAQKGLTRIYRFKEKLEELSSSGKLDQKSLTQSEKKYLEVVDSFKKDFENAMDDDFNTPLAVSIVFDFVNKSNKFFEENTKIDGGLCKYGLDVLLKLGGVLTLFQPKSVKSDSLEDSDLVEKLQNIVSKYKSDFVGKTLEDFMDILLQVREEARKNKDWNTADGIRNELDSLGFEIQDTEGGPVWRKK